MTSRYHDHILQTDPWYLGEEPQNTNSHKTSGVRIKQSNHLSFPRQDDCKTRRKKHYDMHNKTNTYAEPRPIPSPINKTMGGI